MGKKCGRCSTRYCGPECQVQHWKEGGHDKLCKQIKRSGGAEQYNANIKYTEAVTVAAEACADDTKGQTCFICTQALHWKTKEGLVRGCSCRGTSGFAHVSCLAEQAKILYAEAEENNLAWKMKIARWERWEKCSLCEQQYHGVVSCALGWGCWKTYVGRPEGDMPRIMAMNLLGNGLDTAGRHEDALPVREAGLAMRLRLGESEDAILGTRGNLALTYEKLGRLEQSLTIRREVYSGRLRLNGNEHEETLRAANNYAVTLRDLQRFGEAKSLLRKPMLVARRVLGENDDLTLRMRWMYAQSIYRDPGATLDDFREAVTTLEEIERTARRVFGGAHPLTAWIQNSLKDTRAVLRASEGDEVSSVCEAVEKMTPGTRK